jgi:hypothetical protein
MRFRFFHKFRRQLDSCAHKSIPSLARQQVDLVRAQAAEIQTRVDYAKALITQELAVGSLLESHSIVFDDALKGSLWNGATPN